MKKTPFFLGSHDLILDSKNRLSVPASIRKHFDPADEGSLVCTLKGTTPCLYTLGHFRRVHKKQLAPGVLPPDLLKKYTYLILSLGSEVECDAQGRVVLPESILSQSDLGREITLVGVNDHLQLFNRAVWTQMSAKLNAQREVIEQWAEEHLRNPAPENRNPPPPAAS